MALIDTPHFKQIAAICGRLDRDNPAPLYRQLVTKIKAAIRSGELPAGQSLPTQKRLAKLLDVSEITVRSAMAELSYAGLIVSTRGSGTVVIEHPTPGPHVDTPVRSARLRIGVICASVADGYPFVLPILAPIEAGPLGDEDADRPIIQTHYLDPLETDPEVVRQQLPLADVDGLILMSPVNTTALSVCQRRGMPYVLLFNDLSDVGSTCITCDYVPGVYQAVAHLAATGFKRPALVSAGEIRYSTGELIDALTFACEAHHLPLPAKHIVHADYTQEHTYQITRQLLERRDRPDAIFFSSENQAQGGILAAEQLGIEVPKQLAIIATGSPMDDTPLFRRLTIIDLGLAEIGRLAVQFIRRWKSGDHAVPRRSTVRTKLMPGSTTPALKP